MRSRVEFEHVCEQALMLEGPSRRAFLERHLQNENEINRALSYLETLTSNAWPSGIEGELLNEEEDLLGNLIDGRFRITRHLGTGGQGTVFLALDSKYNDREVALKLLPDIFTGNSELIGRFFREAKTLCDLNDDRIVRVFDYGEATNDGRCYIAMEFVDGHDLRTIISGQDIIPIERIVDIAGQVIDGLSALHSNGLVHRDLKPANLMITLGKVRVKIIDLGIARFVGDSEVGEVATGIARSTNAGTLAYMSPEQIKGDDLDWRTDVWSFGVIIYELLTGVRPFHADSKEALTVSILETEPVAVSTFRKDCPRWLTNFIKSCLTKEKAGRFSSFSDFEGSFLNSRHSRYRRHGVLRSFSLLAVLLLIVGLGFALCDKAVFDTRHGRVEVTPGSVKFLETQLGESARNRLSRWNANSRQCKGVVPVEPVFNYWPVTFDRINTPLCSDFPVIDIALDTEDPKFSSNESELRSIKTFNVGDQIVALLYIHNGAADNLPTETVARNVRITTSIKRQQNYYNITAVFTADNSSQKTDFVTIEVPANALLEVVPDSGFVFDYQGNLIMDMQAQDIGNSTYFLGNLDAGFEYSLFISYKLSVTTSGLSL